MRLKHVAAILVGLSSAASHASDGPLYPHPINPSTPCVDRVTEPDKLDKAKRAPICPAPTATPEPKPVSTEKPRNP